jgi:hypothetical protein
MTASERLEALETVVREVEAYLAGYAAGIAMFGDPEDAEELAEIDGLRLRLRAALSSPSSIKEDVK